MSTIDEQTGYSSIAAFLAGMSHPARTDFVNLAESQQEPELKEANQQEIGVRSDHLNPI